MAWKKGAVIGGVIGVLWFIVPLLLERCWSQEYAGMCGLITAILNFPMVALIEVLQRNLGLGSGSIEYVIIIIGNLIIGGFIGAGINVLYSKFKHN